MTVNGLLVHSKKVGMVVRDIFIRVRGATLGRGLILGDPSPA